VDVDARVAGITFAGADRSSLQELIRVYGLT
jgi:hypothetical protein